jgi:membrane-associated phospholipid phosphatase
MTIRRRLALLNVARGLSVVFLVIALVPSNAGAVPASSSQNASTWIEPHAGAWQTWLLASGSQLRPGAPPDAAETGAEIEQLQQLAAQRNANVQDQIAFWDTGSPSYRWNELAIGEALKHNSNSLFGFRTSALLHVAMYDAIIATWDAKYAYQRPRPSDFDPGLGTALTNPLSPSYPSEYAAAAGAASAVLTYLFPDDAQLFADKADEAARSRLLAGVEYPSDVVAGRELGRAVATLAIDWARRDGSDAQWTGSVPTEPGHWNGTNPIAPLAGTWKTWVLSSGSEFRPGPPPAFDSAQETAELNELKAFERTPKTNADAFFWEYASGGPRNYWFWNEQTNKGLLEYRLDANPPRAARAYAAASVAGYDAGVACWDAKYTYWAIRPFQLDPSFKPLFTTPNHPSYPAAHGCFSSAVAAALADLFPRNAQALTALADQAAESRIWAGIHLRSDVRAGQTLGRAVANKVVERAKRDGAE